MQEPVLWPPATGSKIGMADLIEVSSQVVGMEQEGERSRCGKGKLEGIYLRRKERGKGSRSRQGK